MFLHNELLLFTDRFLAKIEVFLNVLDCSKWDSSRLCFKIKKPNDFWVSLQTNHLSRWQKIVAASVVLSTPGILGKPLKNRYFSAYFFCKSVTKPWFFLTFMLFYPWGDTPGNNRTKERKQKMNHHHMNTPIFPGAMTPAQLTRRVLTAAASVASTAIFVAAMFTAAIIFN